MDALQAVENSTPTHAKTAPASESSDFHTFLTLLTAQMRNQDPLKPMESTEFVAQLASFSAVEQQIETNTKLSDLIGLLGEKSSSNLAEWIGKEVLREGSTEFDGDPVEIKLDPDPEADTAKLVVRDSAGSIVYSQVFAPVDTAIRWSGALSNGGVADKGRYRFEIESTRQGELISISSGAVFDLVTEVRLDGGETFLHFPDGHYVDAAKAAAVRLPGV